MDAHSQITQARTEVMVKAPWHRRLKWKIKIYLKRTIGHTRLYESLRVAYRYYTKPKRITTGTLTLEETRAVKAAEIQRIEAPFLQAAYPCPIHGPVYVSGFPNECPKCVVERQGKLPLCGGTPIQVHYNGEFSTAAHRQEIAKTDTQKVADYRPGKRLTVRLYPMHLTPLPPMDVPDSPGTTQTDALFLLDQPQTDTDVTLLRIRKIAG